jgi:type II secretory pathway component PulF
VPRNTQETLVEAQESTGKRKVSYKNEVLDMFLIVLIVSVSGLLSIMTSLVLAAGYGVGMILVAGLIRNARQEISRDGLGRLLFGIAVDQFVSAVLTFVLAMLLTMVPHIRGFFPLIFYGTDSEQQVLVISNALALVCFSLVMTAVGILLLLVRETLTVQGPVQKELDWEPWLRVLVVGGCVLQLPTAFFFFLVSAPFLWQVHRLAKMNRQANLIWTLALAVRRGLPLGREVLTLSKSLWGRQRLRLEYLSENLDAGQSLSNSLERQPGLVPLSVVVQIRLGEDTGTLTDVLAACGAGQLQQYSTNAEVVATQNALMILMIPIMLIPFFFGFIGYYIIPKHKKIFEDSGIQPTELLKFLFSVMDPGLSIATLIGFMSLVFVTAMYFALIRDRERDWPIVSRLAPRSNAPLILRALALLVRESRSLTTGLRALAGSHARQTVRIQLNRVLTQINHGDDAWEALARQRLISRHDLLLLRAAERLRNLPWALEQIADTTERRMRKRLQIALELVVPIAVVIIGLFVLVFTVSLMMPYVMTADQMSRNY